MMHMKSDALRDWLENLRRSGKAVLVEGPKDKLALEQFSIPHLFVLSQEPLYAVAETIAARHRDVVVLTDLDAEGKKLYGKLIPLLKKLGVRIDTEFREFLLRETPLSHIEGLPAYLDHQS